MRANGSFRHGKFHLSRIGKEWKAPVAVASGSAPWILGQIVAAKGDVLRWRGDRLAARR